MSGSNPLQQREEGNRKIREALKSLEKKKAPWYFDAELQQRLAGERTRGRTGLRFAKPLPAYAFSVLVFFALGIIGYYGLFRSAEIPDAAPRKIVDSTSVPANPPVPILVPAEQRAPKAEHSQEPIQGVSARQRSPSPNKPKVTSKSEILERSPAVDEALPATISQPQMKIEYPNQDEVKQPLLEEEHMLPTQPSDVEPVISPTYILDDSIKMERSAIDSLDSLSRKPDSLSEPQE
jgi:hypothetical protein